MFEENGELEKYYKVGDIVNNVRAIESKDCEKPVLKVYKTKAKKGIWTFALGSDKTEYVFYVPEGTIARSMLIIK